MFPRIVFGTLGTGVSFLMRKRKLQITVNIRSTSQKEASQASQEGQNTLFGEKYP
jgi:hypothetical protein